MITTRIIEDKKLIEDACELLYVVHFIQGQWNFSPDNPSEIRVETKNGRKLLVDRFTDKAIWFGTFDGDKLIGCTRLTRPDENNKLEIESYPNSSVIQQYLPKDKSFCVESTRTAISQDYTGKGLVRKILLAAFSYCEEHGYSIAACVSNSYLKSLLQKINYPLKMEHAFKYEDHDPSPVNFYFADYNKQEVKQMINALEGIKGKLNKDRNSMFDALDKVASILPTPVYWHDINGTVLGVNEHCVKAMGTTREIVGKSPYEFYPKEIADQILNHHAQVIRSSDILSQDERIEDITTGKVKYFRNTKAPLYDEEGKIIGIIGSAIDITAEKDAENLKKENEQHLAELKLQKAISEEQEKFREIVAQVNHDIRSPITSLQMLTKQSSHLLPESERNSYRDAIERITDIANNMMNYFKSNVPTEVNTQETNKPQKLLISTELLQVLTEKKYEYSNNPSIKFTNKFSSDGSFAFVNIDPRAFKRMISNIINNAVDAIDKNNGSIIVSLDVVNENVVISIKDNGKGMPDNIKQSIINNISVTSGKENGHGIGYRQIRDTLSNGAGSLEIESEIDKGTTITLKFPKIPTPEWIAEKIELRPNDIIIILDDDPSIHGAWNSRFDNILKNNKKLTIKHFEIGTEAIQFINSLPTEAKKRVFLLTDYELIKQSVNGLNVIEETKVPRSILVTSHHNKESILKQAALTNTKVLPKLLAPEILIILSDNKSKNPHIKDIDLVLVEDDKSLINSFLIYVKSLYPAKKVDVYDNARNFIDNIQSYEKTTVFLIDNQFKNEDISGVEINQKLYKNGYSECYLFTGDAFKDGELPYNIKTILKTDLDKIDELLN